MTIQSHTLVLPYPISANRYWASRTIMPRGGGKPFTSTYVTPEARAYKAKVEEIVKAMGIRKPIGGRVRVDLRLYPHRPQDWQARQRKFGAAWDDSVQCLDLDNARKVAYDALKGLVMEDDVWVRSETGDRMEPDAEGARLEVTVSALPTECRQSALFGEEASA
jgi:crossover junction endodeoxyribonuclease RusA